jgi:hypothetical protein
MTWTDYHLLLTTTPSSTCPPAPFLFPLGTHAQTSHCILPITDYGLPITYSFFVRAHPHPFYSLKGPTRRPRIVFLPITDYSLLITYRLDLPQTSYLKPRTSNLVPLTSYGPSAAFFNHTNADSRLYIIPYFSLRFRLSKSVNFD